MKQRFFILGLLLIGALFKCWGQTTPEEYLYITLGYKEQLQKGLDDKKGYSWKRLYQHKFVNDNGKLVGKKVRISFFEFEGLYRTGEPKPCGVVGIYRETEGTPKKDGMFWCLPHAKSGQDIVAKADKYFAEEVGFDKALLEAYALALHRFTMVLSQN